MITLVKSVIVRVWAVSSRCRRWKFTFGIIIFLSLYILLNLSKADVYFVELPETVLASIPKTYNRFWFRHKCQFWMTITLNLNNLCASSPAFFPKLPHSLNYLASARRMNYCSNLSLQKRQQSHYDFNGPATRRMREKRKMMENWMGRKLFLLSHILCYFWWWIFLLLRRISHQLETYSNTAHIHSNQSTVRLKGYKWDK